MASLSSTLFTSFFILCLLSQLSSGRSDSPGSCSKETTGYSNTMPLPTLNATLHFTYNSLDSSLSILFTAIPPTPDGWIAWGLNPKGMAMEGAEVFAAFKENNTVVVKTYYLKSFKKIIPQKLSFKVWNLRAEQNAGGCISIFATLQVPDNSDTLKHTWQIGASVSSDGNILVHKLDTPNYESKGEINLVGTGFCRSSTSTTAKINHGIMNLVGFGVLFPLGIVIPRYMDLCSYNSLTWFHVSALLQVSGFSLGVAGWLVGIKVGRELGRTLLSGHGIMGTIIILFKTTDKGHSLSNLQHYTFGYATIFFGVSNITLGVKMMNYDESWQMLLYRAWLCILCLFVLVEPLIRYLGRLFRFLGAFV